MDADVLQKKLRLPVKEATRHLIQVNKSNATGMIVQQKQKHCACNVPLVDLLEVANLQHQVTRLSQRSHRLHHPHQPHHVVKQLEQLRVE
jgi:hypothetical protein